MPFLNDINFIDLILGRDFREVKGMTGQGSFISALPSLYNEDADALKNECMAIHQGGGRTEFSLFYRERLYRVTVIANDISGLTFVIRQTPLKPRALNEVPFTTPIITSIERPNATGLMLIAGEMGSGKTTTAAAVLSRRLQCTGHLGVSIEDPIETLSEGRHGSGRCFQLEVSGEETYTSAIKKAYRMGASVFLLGEIRDSVTANEVLRASLSMFVISTIHASNILDAIERYITFCEEVNPMAASTVANTLYIIAYQKMSHNLRDGKIHSRRVELTAFNLKNAKNSSAIAAKIKSRSFRALNDDLTGYIEYEV
ncbi:GspE family protein [Citrobacter sp. Cpo142]|uniref:ATPase, T2SS/T4P/T4SS family n=1 Tax=Citrobacter TaxID=544 RepID=UPI0019057554|nr:MULTISPECIES: ATPase, T2SS/T4P/T4SS family [Citrobacter]EDC2614151.1 conjugal transfer protein [Salmonella enterica]MBJ9635487.1 Flp pilus assembly complex ATPase component TadA [Citrobacter freundii]MDM2776367.1 GspE family protein [Citrobacter sp. Cpo142]HCW0179541.1 Flp pilus assembly complex ATPase component TadA [Citrobacter freundii]